jgi:hypothetical protein
MAKQATKTLRVKQLLHRNLAWPEGLAKDWQMGKHQSGGANGCFAYNADNTGAQKTPVGETGVEMRFHLRGAK